MKNDNPSTLGMPVCVRSSTRTQAAKGHSLHGIYKRRPQTQRTHKPSKTWWTSRVGPKSDGPAWYSMKTTFSTSRLGEVRVPPGPPTGGEPNSHGLPKEGRRWVARPHTGLLHREAPEHHVLTSHASLLHGHNGPQKQDGMPMLRPLARTKPIEPNPTLVERVEAPGLPSHFGCS